MSQKEYYIPVNGRLYKTSKEVYQVYYQMDRRERYLEERDKKKGVINFSTLDNEKFSAEEAISDQEIDIEEEIINKIQVEAVLEAMKSLENEEKWLIQELFFVGKSQRLVSKETGIPLMTLSNRKRKILEKLKNLIKK